VGTAIKDPNAVLPYTLDWGTRYLPSGHVIQTSTWYVPDGITVDSDTNDSTTTTVWLSGGVVGEDYLCVNRIVTDDGITDDRTLLIQVRER